MWASTSLHRPKLNASVVGLSLGYLNVPFFLCKKNTTQENKVDSFLQPKHHNSMHVVCHTFLPNRQNPVTTPTLVCQLHCGLLVSTFAPEIMPSIKPT